MERLQGEGFSITVDPREGFLRLYVAGDDSLEVSLGMWRMARGQCERFHARRLMLVEDLAGNVPVEEAERVVEEISRLGFADTKIAFVDLRGDPHNDEHAETLALEGGLEIHVFTDETSARLWLLYGDSGTTASPRGR
ncbi:hypothetical protein [Lysobacter xanthus]